MKYTLIQVVFCSWSTHINIQVCFECFTCVYVTISINCRCGEKMWIFVVLLRIDVCSLRILFFCPYNSLAVWYIITSRGAHHQRIIIFTIHIAIEIWNWVHKNITIRPIGFFFFAKYSLFCFFAKNNWLIGHGCV